MDGCATQRNRYLPWQAPEIIACPGSPVFPLTLEMEKAAGVAFLGRGLVDYVSAT